MDRLLNDLTADSMVFLSRASPPVVVLVDRVIPPPQSPYTTLYEVTLYHVNVGTGSRVEDIINGLEVVGYPHNDQITTSARRFVETFGVFSDWCNIEDGRRLDDVLKEDDEVKEFYGMGGGGLADCEVAGGTE